MNHKYIDSKTFEIIDDVFEVDEDIAEAISILNKKGYYTKFCCSGHFGEPILYKMYNVKNDEDFKPIGYIVNKNENSYDILVPDTFTSVYIMFDGNYNFNILPEGFEKADNIDNTIEFIISYYIDDVRKDWKDILIEIEGANRRLLEWAKSLPKISK